MAKPRIARLYLRRSFSASHWLPDYNGPCQKMHGHTFKVEVWMTGAVDPKTGMVIDFRKVKDAIEILDHETLNNLPWPELSPPTAENIAFFLLTLIECATKIRVWEGEDAYAEVHRSLLQEYAALTPAECDNLLQERWLEGP